MAIAFCPECDTEIKFSSTPRLNYEVSCSDCGAYLKVVSIAPIELDWADGDFDEEYEDQDHYEYEYDD